MKVELLAPAKINLGLEILGKEVNGYHKVDMIMQTVNLFDKISIKESNTDDIKIICEEEIGCKSENNIAYKAAIEYFAYTKIKNKGLEIKISKNIPICAGLAGGSSDGAAVIVGLDYMFNTKLSKEELMSIGAKVGADVPFCICGGTARATGIGTDLENIKNLVNCNIVLVKPNVSISTKRAYESIDKYGFSYKSRIENLIKSIEMENIEEISKNIFNRFEDVIKKSDVITLHEKFLDIGALNACMSGSGPSVYGIFNDEVKANKCFNVMKSEYRNTFICKPISSGVEIIKK